MAEKIELDSQQSPGFSSDAQTPPTSGIDSPPTSDDPSRNAPQQQQQQQQQHLDLTTPTQFHNPSSQGVSSSGGPNIEPLPLINYTLRTRTKSITIFWFLILIDIVAVPITLYFCLTRYAPQLSSNTVFSISTGALGGVSIIEYFVRFWRLWRHNSNCRVIGAHRWYLDWFHWNFSIAWFFIMIELIVGTVQEFPPIRLLAMPVATMMYWFAFETLLEDVLRFFKIPAPLRISSIPKGAPIRPGIYSVIEDVCAVDGSGGTQYRVELNARYEASHYFRQMLHRLTLFWGLGALAAAVLTTVLVFTIDDEAAYIVGWVLPFGWAGIWAPLTWWYVEVCLKHEKAEWGKAKA